MENEGFIDYRLLCRLNAINQLSKGVLYIHMFEFFLVPHIAVVYTGLDFCVKQRHMCTRYTGRNRFPVYRKYIGK